MALTSPLSLSSQLSSNLKRHLWGACWLKGLGARAFDTCCAFSPWWRPPLPLLLHQVDTFTSSSFNPHCSFSCTRYCTVHRYYTLYMYYMVFNTQLTRYCPLHAHWTLKHTTHFTHCSVHSAWWTIRAQRIAIAQVALYIGAWVSLQEKMHVAKFLAPCFKPTHRCRTWSSVFSPH